MGTPQGGVISPLLANIALQGMEERLMVFAKTLDMKNNKGNQLSWQSKVQSLSPVRYADDFLILHEDIKVILQAKAVIQEWLNQVVGELKPEKTKIAHTLEEYEGNKPGFDFLDFTIRQWNDITLTPLLVPRTLETDIVLCPNPGIRSSPGIRGRRNLTSMKIRVFTG